MLRFIVAAAVVLASVEAWAGCHVADKSWCAKYCGAGRPNAVPSELSWENTSTGTRVTLWRCMAIMPGPGTGELELLESIKDVKQLEEVQFFDLARRREALASEKGKGSALSVRIKDGDVVYTVDEGVAQQLDRDAVVLREAIGARKEGVVSVLSHREEAAAKALCRQLENGPRVRFESRIQLVSALSEAKGDYLECAFEREPGNESREVRSLVIAGRDGQAHLFHLETGTLSTVSLKQK